MNLYLAKNTSRARWQLKKLSVNLKQVCVPLIIAEDRKFRENSLPHIWFNSCFSLLFCILSAVILGADGVGMMGCISKFLFYFNLSVARGCMECILGLTFIVLKRR